MATEDLNELLERVDMAAYLDREGISYRETHGRSGQQLNVRECPTCGNSDWKVYLNAETGVGNCFGGSHPAEERIFTKYRFIQSHLGKPKAGAVVEHIRLFAHEMGWRPARRVSAKVENAPGAWSLPQHVTLPHNGQNIPYLENRGITAELAAYFHLGYCANGSYFRYQTEHGWAFQDYSRRILIPVYDLDGKVATFQGRDVSGHAEKKYLFPPGIDGSGVHLFNGINVQDTRRIVVGEGAFDVAATKIALDGDQDLRDIVPVGTFGKHLSSGSDNSQLAKFQLLKERGVEEVTIMWDGEIRATDDAVTAGMLLKSIGFIVRIAMLPKEKDPNEVSAEIVRAAYYQATLLNRATANEIMMRRRIMNG
ncbi:MAG: DNA primase [Pseudomonadota bacterium]|nr:DNA primase [Pseudomonadota bacterium]